jgi:hypothetical protein
LLFLRVFVSTEEGRSKNTTPAIIIIIIIIIMHTRDERERERERERENTFVCSILPSSSA